MFSLYKQTPDEVGGYVLHLFTMECIQKAKSKCDMTKEENMTVFCLSDLGLICIRIVTLWNVYFIRAMFTMHLTVTNSSGNV